MEDQIKKIVSSAMGYKNEWVSLDAFKRDIITQMNEYANSLDKKYSLDELKTAFDDGRKMVWADVSQEEKEFFYYYFDEWFKEKYEDSTKELLTANNLNKSNDKYKQAIEDVLELLDGNGVPNLNWIKNRLEQSLKR